MSYPMLLPMDSANAANAGFSQLTTSTSAPNFFGQLAGTSTSNVSSSRHFNSNAVFPLIRDVPPSYSSAVTDTGPSTTTGLSPGGKRFHENAAFTTEVTRTTSSISASSSVATAITRNISVPTDDSPYSEITPTSKRSRTATYNPPREVPNSILTAVGSLVGGTTSISASGKVDNSNNSMPTVTMRRNHSYNQIAPFVGNHDEMDTTDSYNNSNNTDSTRARSMSF